MAVAVVAMAVAVGGDGGGSDDPGGEPIDVDDMPF